MICEYTQSVQNPVKERMCHYVNEEQLTNRHFEYCLDCLWQNMHIHGKMFFMLSSIIQVRAAQMSGVEVVSSPWP